MLTEIEKAVAALRAGRVIAYPTEAVFGLGCDPENESALQNVIDVKGRDSHKGFILIASSQDQLREFIAPVSVAQQEILDAHWPGPVTFVVPANTRTSNTLLSGYRDTLAVRVSTHPVVIQLCEQFGSAIVSTSANLSGQEASRSAQEVRTTFGNKLDVVIDAEVGTLNEPTKIIDLRSGERLR